MSVEEDSAGNIIINQEKQCPSAPYLCCFLLKGQPHLNSEGGEGNLIFSPSLQPGKCVVLCSHHQPSSTLGCPRSLGGRGKGHLCARPPGFIGGVLPCA